MGLNSGRGAPMMAIIVETYSRSVPMDVLERIKEQVEGNPIIIYMKGTPQFPMCGFSSRAAAALQDCGEKFAYVNVLQDPDQNFDPNDGFSNPHQVNVSGAALLRFRRWSRRRPPNGLRKRQRRQAEGAHRTGSAAVRAPREPSRLFSGGSQSGCRCDSTPGSARPRWSWRQGANASVPGTRRASPAVSRPRRRSTG